MTLKDLGPQALVSRNICYQQYQFLMRGLGDMSSDGRTTTTTVCSPEIFSESIKKLAQDIKDDRQKDIDKQTEMY
jgi:hypothetical protein